MTDPPVGRFFPYLAFCAETQLLAQWSLFWSSAQRERFASPLATMGSESALFVLKGIEDMLQTEVKFFSMVRKEGERMCASASHNSSICAPH